MPSNRFVNALKETGKEIGNKFKEATETINNKPKEDDAPFETEEDLMNYYKFQPSGDDSSWFDQNGNRIMKADYAQYIKNNKDIPTTTITTTEGTVLPVSNTVDATKLGGVASIEERNKTGDVSSTPVYQTTAQPDISKEEDVATPEDEATGDAMVQEAEVKAQESNPADISQSVEDLFTFLEQKGLIVIDPKTQEISFAQPKKSTASFLARIGTIVSSLACVATSGLIPPMNLYKLSGREDADKRTNEQYTTLMSAVSKELGSVLGDYYRARADTESQKQAGVNRLESSGTSYQMDKATEGQIEVMKQQLENTLIQMKQGHANQKELTQLIHDLSVRAPMDAVAFLQQHPEIGNDKETIKNIARLRAADAGITPNQQTLNTIKSAEEAITMPIEAIGKMIPGGK